MRKILLFSAVAVTALSFTSCSKLRSLSADDVRVTPHPLEAVGNEVLFLRRLSMGNLELDEDLSPGQYRPLTGQEIELLKNGR